MCSYRGKIQTGDELEGKLKGQVENYDEFMYLYTRVLHSAVDQFVSGHVLACAEMLSRPS